MKVIKQRLFEIFLDFRKIGVVVDDDLGADLNPLVGWLDDVEFGCQQPPLIEIGADRCAACLRSASAIGPSPSGTTMIVTTPGTFTPGKSG